MENKIPSKKKFRKGLLGAAGLSVAFGGLLYLGKLLEPRLEYQSFITYPVDQVFRNHDGYQIRWTNDKNIDEERKYEDYFISDLEIKGIPKDIAQKFVDFDGKGRPVMVIRDLEEGTRGFVEVLFYKHYNILIDGSDSDRQVVQIHLPKSEKISPGIETWGGKFHKSDTIKEIK